MSLLRFRHGPAFVLAAGLLLAGGEARAEKVRESHPLLGALLEITVEGLDRDAAHDSIQRAMEVARRLEAQFDLEDPGSAVARLNATAGRGRVRLPLDVYRLLALSQLMTRSTGGAFDVTVGPLVRRRQAAGADRGARLGVGEALALVGADKIVLHPPDAAELTGVGMAIDFTAVARGYTLERMAASLRAGGVGKALLRFDDTIALAIGPPAGEAPFRVWVTYGKSTTGSVALRDRALSTTRARRRGEESSAAPIVDPRSGRLVEVDRQATVVARDAALADAWSTALVVDPDGALGLLAEPRDVEALVYDEHGEHRSPRFEAFAGWKAGRREPDGEALPQDEGAPAVPAARP